MKTKIVITDCTDPHINLAAEEHLTFGCSRGEVIMYLWQNADTVVIGRNQNPWQECRIEEMKKNGCALARRLSGGGAVYHDLGNLNFTFIARSEDYDVMKQTGVILGAVKSLGIKAERNGRNDLVIPSEGNESGLKFSGHAYYRYKDFRYHHGTVMVDVDPSPLSLYLNVPADKLKSKSVTSVKSRVTNLNNHAPDITIAKMHEALIEAFCKIYQKPRDGGIIRLNSDSEFYKTPEMVSLIAKYDSEKWNYGRRIPFDLEIKSRFPWGGVTAQIHVIGGVIKDAAIYSDSLETEIFSKIAMTLNGLNYSIEGVNKLPDAFVGEGEEDLRIASDVADMIIEELK